MGFGLMFLLQGVFVRSLDFNAHPRASTTRVRVVVCSAVFKVHKSWYTKRVPVLIRRFLLTQPTRQLRSRTFGTSTAKDRSQLLMDLEGIQSYKHRIGIFLMEEHPFPMHV